MSGKIDEVVRFEIVFELDRRGKMIPPCLWMEKSDYDEIERKVKFFKEHPEARRVAQKPPPAKGKTGRVEDMQEATGWSKAQSEDALRGVSRLITLYEIQGMAPHRKAIPKRQEPILIYNIMSITRVETQQVSN